MIPIPDDDDEIDSIIEDCGESLTLCDEEARASVRHYAQVMEQRLGNWRPAPSRSDPRSVLHGL
jgi:hypothetical protein